MEDGQGASHTHCWGQRAPGKGLGSCRGPAQDEEEEEMCTEDKE